MSLILGIDPGFSKMGWGIIDWDKNRMHYIAAGVMKSQGENAAMRLASIGYFMKSLLQDYKLQEVALEDVFVARNVASTMRLGEVRGVIMAHAAAAGLAIASYAPRFIKKNVTGNGAASKQQTSLMVRHLLQKPPENLGEDGWDALAVALCHGLVADQGRENS